MATKALAGLTNYFPSGTTIGAYPLANWTSGTIPKAGVAAPGSATNSQSVAADGTATFTGLAASTEYVAGADLGGGAWKYVHFDTFVPTTAASQSDITTAVAAEATARDSAIATAQLVTPNVQTGDYTLVLGDANKAVEANKASAIAITVPTNASVAFPVGTVIEIAQVGAGTATITAAGGVTFESRGSKVALNGQYAVASIRKTATNTWVLAGDLA